MQAWAIVSIGYQQQRRKAAGEMPSKKLLMKKKGESEGPVLRFIFIVAFKEKETALHQENISG